MRKKGRLFKVVAALFTCALVLTGCQNSGSSAKHQTSNNYKPVKITETLTDDNSGPTYKYTIKKMPNHVIVKTAHLADIFFDLRLEKHMAGYVPGMTPGTDKYPGQNKVKKLNLHGNDMQPLPKETVLKNGCDFLVAWGSTFSNGQFTPKFCKQNGIIPYRPHICTDGATFSALYEDYHTFGKIFKVQKLANQRVNAMKATIKNVHKKLGSSTYAKPLSVVDIDFVGPHAVIGAKGMPGNIIQNAGGKSAISNTKFAFSPVSWEQVIKANPDVIVINNYGTRGDLQRKENFLKKNAKTKNLRAVKKNRIYGVSSTDMVGSAGSAKAVEQLAKDFYPNKF